MWEVFILSLCNLNMDFVDLTTAIKYSRGLYSLQDADMCFIVTLLPFEV